MPGTRSAGRACAMTLTLLVATASFPFGEETDFLEREISSLASRFDRVVLLPIVPDGHRYNVPSNVTTDLRVAGQVSTRARRILSAFRSRRSVGLIREAVRNTRTPASVASWMRLLAAVGTAERVHRWAELFETDGPTLALTVWAGPATLGLARAAIPTVTRAHGGDLYAERHPHDYLPLQHEILASSAAVHPVSQHGADYLRNRFPDLAPKISVRHLGIVGAEQVAQPSSDGVLRIVTCSSLTAVKRPALIAEIIAAVGHASSAVEWDHFGSGPLESEVRAVAERFPPSVRWTLHGRVPNTRVLEHFASLPVDVFLNASSSEGVPVSIMEAASAGVPVVAPNVGGIGEIVDDRNGRLFDRDASPAKVAALIVETVAAFATTDRSTIRDSWRTRFSAEVNYDSFADELAHAALGSRR